MKKLTESLKKLNYRLYFALLLLGLCPTVYTTVRIFFLGQMPDAWAYSVAGQLGWVNLLYEVLGEAILLPLYYFTGQAADDREQFRNRLRSGLLVTFCIYTVFSVFLITAVRPMLRFMAASPEILEPSVPYIRIESIAEIFGMLSSYVLIALVTLGRVRCLYFLTAARLVLSVLSDVFLVSSLPVSLKLGVNGIGWSNLLVNILLLAGSLYILGKEGIKVFSREALSFGWMREFLRVGGLSGLESLVRNLAYMLMVVRMVNAVGEQGLYWVANSFIWSWLLLPVTELGELIKQEISRDRSAVDSHTRGYFGVTGIICLLWAVSIPGWKPFMRYVLGYADTQRLFSLVLLLLGFYVLYAFQNVFDATFYGLGKTEYMLFESVVTNTVYYGGAFLLYRAGAWTPTLSGIALLFGWGMAFDSVVSFLAYRRLLSKKRRAAPRREL